MQMFTVRFRRGEEAPLTVSLSEAGLRIVGQRWRYLGQQSPDPNRSLPLTIDAEGMVNGETTSVQGLDLARFDRWDAEKVA